ncbi:class I SAM-dependent methyltransferase [Dictyobacter kobayashii]|uniref:Putative methyltransferase YcgJ n=1 Tax=Dictyobacter kobayashii TaxID=2014872 RepID=A0A402AU69_9CHLR|nr:methyltransferase domain-containing protein [Dictyobacter kobayashii]GCE22651.1 putative methyltransferase YcgJ [Dictyobacter kobayashii]
MTQNSTHTGVSQPEEQAQNQLIQQRFGVVAKDYVTSAVHAQGPDLPWLVEVAALTGNEVVVDLATGAGHTAYALAPYAREVIAIDFTVPMLEAAEKRAQELRLDNIRFVEGDAHSLPLAAQSVDVLACRLAAHHFIDIEQAVREWARVLKSGGKLLLIDSIGPEDPTLDEYVNLIEVLRDPSHVRNHSVSEWIELLNAAGIAARHERTWGIHMDVPTWTQRQRTPAQNVERILQLFSTATVDARTYLNIELNDNIYTFDLPAALITGIRA